MKSHYGPSPREKPLGATTSCPPSPFITGTQWEHSPAACTSAFTGLPGIRLTFVLVGCKENETCGLGMVLGSRTADMRTLNSAASAFVAPRWEQRCNVREWTGKYGPARNILSFLANYGTLFPPHLDSTPPLYKIFCKGKLHWAC